MTPHDRQRVGVVAIGRNEGERLRRCLESVVGVVGAIAYVDSASTDGSLALARARGVEAVELDMSLPFSAGRARNAGFERLLRVAPGLEYVQFLDGDCELVPDWLERALPALTANPDLALVCGRRRERFPERTIYNRLCDIEWDTPIGEARSSGGDFLARAAAFRQVGGFDPSVIAGEEPEMCFRIRTAGWRICRLDAEMTLHDADITRLGQWWRRAVRSGHAYAQGWAMHGASPERFCLRETRSIWVWGAALPLLAGALVVPSHGLSVLLLLTYPAQVVRVAVRLRRDGMRSSDAWCYSASCALAKWAQLCGQIRFFLGRLRGRRPRIIEYK